MLISSSRHLEGCIGMEGGMEGIRGAEGIGGKLIGAAGVGLDVAFDNGNATLLFKKLRGLPGVGC